MKKMREETLEELSFSKRPPPLGKSSRHLYARVVKEQALLVDLRAVSIFSFSVFQVSVQSKRRRSFSLRVV
jgi:hypothetical protein